MCVSTYYTRLTRLKRQLTAEEAQKRAKKALWREGNLIWKLHSTQRDMYEKFKTSSNRTFSVVCSRRLGKSYLMCVLALEEALSGPNRQIRYAAPTAKMVSKIVLPLMRTILEDCPADLKPQYIKAEGIYRFPNDSEIHVAGCDLENADRLRGSATNLFIVDEAGFVDKLRYVVGSILLPQTLTNNGRGILASTPGLTPDHEFHTYATECESKGAYAHYTIYDNPLLTSDVIEEFKKEAGGEDTTEWKREYLAQWIAEEKTAIIPEFTPEREAVIACEFPIPTQSTKYVAIDMGFTDLTVALFGFYDFERARVCIQDELVFEGTAPSDIIEACLAKEAELWGREKPHLRVCDVDSLLLEELNKNHKYNLIKPEKYNKEAHINNVRMLVKNSEIRIDPKKCPVLLSHLRNGIWNERRSEFARSGEYGHFDAIDALIYFVRHLNKAKNPFGDPIAASFNPHTQFWHPRFRRNNIKNRGLANALSRTRKK